MLWLSSSPAAAGPAVRVAVLVPAGAVRGGHLTSLLLTCGPAAQNGISISNRGRVPDDVVAQYKNAQGAPPADPAPEPAKPESTASDGVEGGRDDGMPFCCRRIDLV